MNETLDADEKLIELDGGATSRGLNGVTAGDRRGLADQHADLLDGAGRRVVVPPSGAVDLMSLSGASLSARPPELSGVAQDAALLNKARRLFGNAAADAMSRAYAADPM